MFLPTKSHNEFLEQYKKEPSIRIGKSVPKNAVNMAYYFNPTATDAEKVLCADAPRNTIDHRVEEKYRYLFDVPEADDNLFEASVTWTDEEGYSGTLPRVWVKWYEKNHVTEKNMQINKTFIVDNKGDVPTSIDYQDEDNFEGNLFIDTTSYEVKNTKTEIINTTLKMEVKDHELLERNIGNNELNHYMKNPSVDSSSPWPKELFVKTDGVYDSAGNKLGENTYDGYVTTTETGPLICTSIEKDPLKGTTESANSYQETLGYISLYAKQVSTNPFTKESFTTESEINDFISMLSTYECNGLESGMGKVLDIWKNASASEKSRFSIKIYRKDFEEKTINDESAIQQGVGGTYYLAGYNMLYVHMTGENNGNTVHNWNVYANYSGILSKPYEEIRIYPISWEAQCHYTGIIRKVWNTYDGIAYYRGSVIKGDGIGNVNPELNPDILMFPDDDGFLRTVDADGNNYYKIEAEQFYITDVFKDNTPCFYKYDLKYPIHDYRGPDDNGFYEGNAVKVYTGNLKNIPNDYKYQLKLKPLEYETNQEVINGEIKETQKVKKYSVSLYTSFISKTIDTYKATYNAFIEFDTDTIINNNNGINEDIYNKPFMHNEIDYKIVELDKYTRSNKIKILKPNIINDTRRYITFEYQVIAYKKITGGAGGEKVFTSQKRQARILNKEYAVESEYNKFIDRAMIISPMEYGIYMSPFDIIIKDQSISGQEPIITPSNSNEFIFYCKPVEDTLNSNFVGAFNISCNTDGSGVITAETTIDTGFYNQTTGLYTKKLIINNPYIVENNKIYAGYMVKCLDVRNISVKPPREEHLLESWYPLIQFGHYSQVMDQYGAHTKVCYSMPEYDDQHWGKYQKPFVDILKEEAEILNPHMIKVRNYPLYLRDDVQTVKVYRQKEDEIFDINIDNISFSEGIIITKDAISENDTILVDYTYLEEFYVYRGFNRNQYDFCRIDLNANQYHTYSDLNKEPSELAPTKNLFNKTIYFYLRPTIKIRGEDIEKDTEEKEEVKDEEKDEFIEIDTEADASILKTLWEEANIIKFNNNGIQTAGDKNATWTYDQNIRSIKSITNEPYYYTFLTGKTYKEYEHNITIASDDSDNDVIAIVISAIKKDDGKYETLSLIVSLEQTGKFTNLSDNKLQLALVYNYYQSRYTQEEQPGRQKIIAVDNTFNVENVSWNQTEGMRFKIQKTSEQIKIYRTELGQINDNQISNTPIIDVNISDITNLTGTDFTEGNIGYGNFSQNGVYFSNIKVGSAKTPSTENPPEVIPPVEKPSTEIKWDTENPLVLNDLCLYHTIDKYEPESEMDIYIGSVYIRQNTSLHSTILVDTRTRGGGVLEEMKDSLRKQLEPESDFYLDIGCYDGIPYQENAVIIIRLDNSILKEYGGRFTQTDIEERVHKWLGVGIYPIIEYVDSYSKYDMPQYNLIVENSYTNVINQTPELTLECISD